MVNPTARSHFKLQTALNGRCSFFGRCDEVDLAMALLAVVRFSGMEDIRFATAQSCRSCFVDRWERLTLLRPYWPFPHKLQKALNGRCCFFDRCDEVDLAKAMLAVVRFSMHGRY